jgi:hypothetical protein
VNTILFQAVPFDPDSFANVSYLTKISDQVVALVSPDHAEVLVWKSDKEEKSATYADNNEFDRLFTFEVAQTNEQQEDVKTRPGIQVHSCDIKTVGFLWNDLVSTDVVAPYLLRRHPARMYSRSVLSSAKIARRRVSTRLHHD